ncbi:larval cuticle protein 65Ag1, partial [Daphnia magna]|uniref:larval cuticle protein 65Ag1 n=1 Tax=Daphnia magna TaxID=35525 RepID=UPI001E1BC58B
NKKKNWIIKKLKQFFIAAFLTVAIAAPKGKRETEESPIVVNSQSDVRNPDGSSQWSYTESDDTTREETQVQKKTKSISTDSYGKPTVNEEIGNTNKGSSYWISPEGQKISLTWVADEGGFQPKGDHLPVAPVHVFTLPVAPALPYQRTGLGY